MRPLYQLYHEVRGELDLLQGSIEKKYGVIPPISDENTSGSGSGSGSGSVVESEKNNKIGGNGRKLGQSQGLGQGLGQGLTLT